MSKALSVSQLTRRIQNDLADYGPVVVSGELSQVSVSGAGHCYATLRDDAAVLPIVLWRSTVTRRGGPPKQGEQVEVRGQLDVYPPRGAYQLIATRVSPAGQGDLAARFEALKAALSEEGLFDEDRKRELPWLPRAVGLATADGSAALADMLEGLDARFPTMSVIHAPCLVQGPNAPTSIIDALETLDADPDIEVIICGRGGGSLEDLWAFNDERVVRAIAACQTPVISAVGHETDTSLADLVADVRAKTPTAAADLAVPEFDAIVAQLDEHQADLDTLIDGRLAEAQAHLAALQTHRALARPGHRITLLQQRVDEAQSTLGHLISSHLRSARNTLDSQAMRLTHSAPARQVDRLAGRIPDIEQRLSRAIHQRLQATEQHFGHVVAQMEALSPLAVIARGYAVVRDQDNRLIRQAASVTAGDTLRIRLSDGWIDAEATGSRDDRLRDAGEVYRAD